MAAARAGAMTQPAPSGWTTDPVLALFELPFPEVLYRAQTVHRRHFAPDAVQLSQLLSIKTGGCPEDCLEPHQESVPINHLVQVAGTPLHGAARLDPLEFVRTIAAARISMPSSFVRLSAGRAQMSDAEQALCFLAGANSIFCGDKLLTTGNPDVDSDHALLERLELKPLPA